MQSCWFSWEQLGEATKALMNPSESPNEGRAKDDPTCTFLIRAPGLAGSTSTTHVEPPLLTLPWGSTQTLCLNELPGALLLLAGSYPINQAPLHILY